MSSTAGQAGEGEQAGWVSENAASGAPLIPRCAFTFWSLSWLASARVVCVGLLCLVGLQVIRWCGHCLREG